MKNMKKNLKTTTKKTQKAASHSLLKINILFSVFIVLANFIAFIFCDSNKNSFFILSTIFNVFLFFIYRFIVNALIKGKWYALKAEIMYVNYPITIGVGFGILCAILIANLAIIARVNESALNVTFATAFFINTIMVLIPSILLFIYMFLLMPAFVIPSYELKRKKDSGKLLYVLFAIFLLAIGIKTVFDYSLNNNFVKRDKFKIAKMVFSASENFLKYVDLSDVTEERLKEEGFEVPFLYTIEGFPAKSYSMAENFCNSIGANVASHKEIYNIIFNRFDLFGEKYYWTSDTAGKNQLLLHFKNMSYEIVKSTGNESPIVYCTSEYNKEDKRITNYFYKTPVIEYNDGAKSSGESSYSPQNLNMQNNNQGWNNDNPKEMNMPPVDESISGFVNFTIKHVSPQYLNEMINSGYNYSFEVQRSQDMYPQGSYYSSSRKLQEGSEIRLCYFPAIDYSSVSKPDEIQIWQQNFCYPGFELANIPPAIKTKYEKDSYCMANGGRLPNIAELVAILKLNNEDIFSYKFWTNIKVTNYGEGLQNSVAISFAQNDLVIPEIITNRDEQAVTYCVKNPKSRPVLISNFKSRYRQYDGSYHAKSLCYNCKYYEMPDMVAD